MFISSLTRGLLTRVGGFVAVAALALCLPVASFAGYWQTSWHMRAGDAVGGSLTESGDAYGMTGLNEGPGQLLATCYTTGGNDVPFMDIGNGSANAGSVTGVGGGSTYMIISATWIPNDPSNPSSDPAPSSVTLQFKRKMAGQCEGSVLLEGGASGTSTASGDMSCKFVGTDEIAELSSTSLGGSCSYDGQPYGGDVGGGWGGDFLFEDANPFATTLSTDANGVASLAMPITWAFSGSSTLPDNHGNSFSGFYAEVTFSIEGLAIVP